MISGAAGMSDSRLRLSAAIGLIFVVGEALIVSGAAMTLEASAPSFAAGVVLWAASLALVIQSAYELAFPDSEPRARWP